MKRRILIVVTILSLTLATIPASASASATPCDTWAYRFWGAMARSDYVAANFAYGMWLGCTVNSMMGR